jgi:general secretion pathway protein A
MYKAFYGLKASPFQISTDPKFLWLGGKHREAIAMLKYGIQAKDHTGMVLLTGDTGTGKTTLINALFQSLDRSVIRAAIKNPSLDGLDFFNYLSAVFGSSTTFASKGLFLLAFEQFLKNAAAKKKKILLVIDEAQLLTDKMLEEIRLLTNFERNGQSLIHIFLMGQQDLRDKLSRPVNKALNQRITLNFHIDPLAPDETEEYIRYRLQVAGTSRQIFIPEAARLVHRFSQGLPRQINIICDHALLTGFVRNLPQIPVAVIHECAKDLTIPRFPEHHQDTAGIQPPGARTDPGPENGSTASPVAELPLESQVDSTRAEPVLGANPAATPEANPAATPEGKPATKQITKQVTEPATELPGPAPDPGLAFQPSHNQHIRTDPATDAPLAAPKLTRQKCLILIAAAGILGMAVTGFLFFLR